MKTEYLDKYGNDSLKHLILASQNECEYFITTNQGLLEDKEELEKEYKIKIRSPNDMVDLERNKNG